MTKSSYSELRLLTINNYTMARFLTLLALLSFGVIAVTTATENEWNPAPKGNGPIARITGGSAAKIYDYPFQLSLRSKNSHICGAVLISPYWALTAANCVLGEAVSSLSLMGGSANRLSGGIVRNVASVQIHPQYSLQNFDNDVALLKVSAPFALSQSVQPIQMASHVLEVRDGSAAAVSGWGQMSISSTTLSPTLQQVTVPIVNQKTCSSLYGSQRVTINMICAGYLANNKGACVGDAGGPLTAYVDNVQRLIGIFSWGRNGCSQPNYPAVFTKIAAVRLWILATSGV